jgi:hypothetical protein
LNEALHRIAIARTHRAQCVEQRARSLGQLANTARLSPEAV